jgi:hypothetical protein
VFCTYDNYWNNWTIRGLKVRVKPYFIGFTTKYDEPCFHIPVIVQHSYLYNLISKHSNSKYLFKSGDSDVLSLTFDFFKSFSKIIPF